MKNAMLSKWSALFVAALMCVSAKETQADSCDAVYADSIRSSAVDTSSYKYLHTVYDQYCSLNGESKNEYSNISLEAVVKAIPIKFGSNSGSASERLSTFCRNYSSVRFSTEYNKIEVDEAVTENLESYNRCRLIQAKTGVTISHAYIQPGAVQIFFDFANSFTDLRLEHVTTGPNTQCGTTALDAGGKWTQLGKQAHSIKSNFVILCERAGRIQNDGSTEFSPTWIGIGTNVSSYSIPVQQDVLYANHLASDYTEKVVTLETELLNSQEAGARLREHRDALQRKIDRLSLKTHRVMIGQSNFNPGGGYDYYGCGTKWADIEAKLCKGASISKLTPAMSRGGEQCGYASAVVSCVFAEDE